jgi:hypothetical protein
MPAGNEGGKTLPRSCQMASRFFEEEPPNLKRAVGPMFVCLVMGFGPVSKVSLGVEVTIDRKPC